MDNTINLITDLNTIRKLLIDLSDRLETSGVERTKGLCNALGPSCTYYKKSLQLFLENDYEQLRDLVTKIKNEFDIAEKGE